MTRYLINKDFHHGLLFGLTDIDIFRVSSLTKANWYTCSFLHLAWMTPLMYLPMIPGFLMMSVILLITCCFKIWWSKVTGNGRHHKIFARLAEGGLFSDRVQNIKRDSSHWSKKINSLQGLFFQEESLFT